MGQVSVSLPSDGETIDVSDYNTPINTIVNDYNSNIDNSNIAAAAAIAGSKIADASITPSKWTNPYCFRAYDSAGTTLTDGTATKINFATEEYDYNNNFASSTYTAPIDGVYSFSAAWQFATAVASGVLGACLIRKNNTTNYQFMAGAAASSYAYGITIDLLLAAGDTIEVYGYQDSAGNEATATGSTLTWFSGRLVHAT